MKDIKQKDNVCTKIKNITLISQSDFSSLCLIVVSILLSYVVMDTGSTLLVH